MSGSGNHQHGLVGEKNSSWKGGLLFKNGYFYVYAPNHHEYRKDEYVKRCRLVMEQKIGRLLLESEHVHHINEDKTDDRPENLEIVSLSQHSSLHCRLNPMPKDAQTGRFVSPVEEDL